MDQQKNKQKKAVSDSPKTQKDFILMKELTEKDFLKLPETVVILRKQITKNGFERAFIEITFIKDIFKFTLPISVARFNLLRNRLDLDLYDDNDRVKNDYKIKARYRFVKGVSNYGEYYSLEIIFTKGVYETYFINDYDEKESLLGFADRGLISLKWYDRPDKVKSTDTINYQWDQ